MKEKMEPDKVLRFAIVAVILLFLIGALIIGTRMMNPRVDATEGVKKLTERKMPMFRRLMPRFRN